MILIIITFILIQVFIFFIWDIKEPFNNRLFLWMPTRNTRLMSYDLRGDPHGLIIYPSYNKLSS